MLILRRKPGQRIIIGGGDSGIPEIVILFSRAEGDDAVIGIEADRSVPIHRDKVHEEILSTEGSIRPGRSSKASIDFRSSDINRRAKGDA